MDKYKTLNEVMSVLLTECITREQVQKMSYKIIDIATEAALKKIMDMQEDEPQKKLEDIITDLSKDKPVIKIKEPDKSDPSDNTDDQISLF